MNRFALIATAAAALTFAGTGAALADDCSGHSHDTGTAVGAVGGAAIGGLASHSVVGAVAGAVVGGVAGNAIDRSQDCTAPGRRNAKIATPMRPITRAMKIAPPKNRLRHPRRRPVT